ncbi:MAG TPA: VOC family protein [Anaerolineales bacterium]|nr:VOC family protein [Anaerolineales bacterium]
MITNRSLPPGVIIPELPYDDVNKAGDWLCQAFGFKLRLRIGDHRCQLSFGESSVVAIERKEPGTSYILMHVDNVDHYYERALQSGARIINPPADYPFGERQCTVADLGGHHWTFSQTIADVDPKTWGGELA